MHRPACRLPLFRERWHIGTVATKQVIHLLQSPDVFDKFVSHDHSKQKQAGLWSPALRPLLVESVEQSAHLVEGLVACWIPDPFATSLGLTDPLATILFLSAFHFCSLCLLFADRHVSHSRYVT
jgi:hypothetical protein